MPAETPPLVHLPNVVAWLGETQYPMATQSAMMLVT
jgi:hypothetical protein